MSITPSTDYLQSATRWFGRSVEALGAVERKALEQATRRQTTTLDPNEKLDSQASFGERLTDRVAMFGGSWAFMSLFGGFLLIWTVLNTEVLGKTAFDPYPFIFLNLMLSILAAAQAPIIMMSQNRQASKDRLMAAHDYEVNLRAEIEIMALHDKIDALRSEQLVAMLNKQQEQIELLTRLLSEKSDKPD